MTTGSGWARRGPTHTKRLSGWEWQRIAARTKARDNYQCLTCMKRGLVVMAHEVDHVIPIAQGGTNDESNLASICTPCHKAKSEREGVRFGKPKPTIDVDGWPTA